ncbi:MAG: BON domain-containing protein [Magnetococcales bacterium]|nr:BON domain-containing protein [Magnetococcales bacterium]
MKMIQRQMGSLLLLASLSGCIPVVVGGGMAATTSVVGERRDLTSQMEDSWVAMKIRSRFVQSDQVRIGNVAVSVYNGKVLLTGSAINQEEVDEAIRIARETRGVTEVRSELKVQYVSPSELANDALITSKVKAQMMVDQDVHSLDVHVKTTKGVVYLTGEARTEQERSRAIYIAQRVPDVREVVSFIDIRPPVGSTEQPGRAAETAPAVAPGTTPAPASAGYEGNSGVASPDFSKTSGTVHESISPVAAPGTTTP